MLALNSDFPFHNMDFRPVHFVPDIVLSPILLNFCLIHTWLPTCSSALYLSTQESLLCMVERLSLGWLSFLVPWPCLGSIIHGAKGDTVT